MRHLGYALVVVVCSLSVALAGPKKAPKGAGAAKTPAGAKAPVGAPTPPGVKKVDPKLQAELTKVQADYYAASGKQQHYLAAKLAKKLYELQVKATGADSVEAERQLQLLANAQSSAGDYVNAEKNFKD